MIITTEKVMRPRDTFDHYPTPDPVAGSMCSYVNPDSRGVEYILDPGAGTGVFGRAARARWPGAVIVGTDIRALSRPRAYNFWYSGATVAYDFIANPECAPIFDLVIGNPPYGKIGRYKVRNAAELFVRKSLELTRDGGIVAFLLRLAFLEGQDRGADFWQQYPPEHVKVCSERVSYTGDGRTDATAYAFFYWRKGWHGLTTIDWDVPAALLSRPKQLTLEGIR